MYRMPGDHRRTALRYTGILLLRVLPIVLSFCDHINVPRTRTSFGLFLSSEMKENILSIAEDLWGDEAIPRTRSGGTQDAEVSGEARFPTDGDFSKRALFFETLALQGDPCAQHSLGLLLWSGCHCQHDPAESAKWHAAAAAQNHLDGIAVLGGCLRTGTGVGKAKDVAFGLELIEYSASKGNPTGINKMAALEEANGNYEEAFRLYNECRDNANALLLMNLGWCYVNGEGTAKDTVRGEGFWRQATDLAPDEGSEEAAWLLYLNYKRDDPREADRWQTLAANLGHGEAIEEGNTDY